VREPGRQAALGFILASVALDAVSSGLVFPVLPRLVLQLSAGDDVLAARTVGLIAGAWALMNFLGAPVLGAISDRFGRRPVLLISTFGLSLDLVITALAPNLAWLFVARLLSGLTAASSATASAYLADITPPDRRAQRFGLFSAVYGAGMILGPAIGGLLGEISPRAPFWAAAALTGLGWLYGLLVLPESLPPERRARISWRAANPVKSFGVLAADKVLLGLAGVTGLMMVAFQAANTLFVLYAGRRYGWGSAEMGLLLMAFSAGNILVMALIAPRLVPRIGERTTLLVGFALSTVGFVGLGLARTSLEFCIACVPTCLGNMSGPPLQALESRRVDEAQQGRLQGALSGIVALSTLVGPIAFTQIYALSVRRGAAPAASGLALLVGAVLLMAAFALSFIVTRPLEVRRSPSWRPRT
jgi:DHA1 family tetracycline resistance protein-like MFS transporter